MAAIEQLQAARPRQVIWVSHASQANLVVAVDTDPNVSSLENLKGSREDTAPHCCLLLIETRA